MLKLIIFAFVLIIVSKLFKVHNTINDIDQATIDELTIIK